MRYLYFVLLSLLAGFILGKYAGIDVGGIYEMLLYLLIFFIGMDLGLGNLREFKKAGKTALLLPVITITGALLGGVAGAFILSMPLKWALAVTAGCGWYSLTGPLIAQYSPFYGTIGFLSNLIREIIMVVGYPWGVQKVSGKILVSIGGATTMDSTLGIVKKFGKREDVLVAFVHGFIVTTAVMFMVPLILQL